MTQTGTQAIDRAALLLTRVVNGAEPTSFSELTAASGLAKSTASRLLTALERHQLVRRDDDGRFVPGELFVRYAWQGTANADLIAIAQPFLQELGVLTGETINLSVVSGQSADATVDQISQVDSRFMIGGTNWVGLVVPLHCSASGKVLLAYGAAPLPAGPYEPRTEKTITSRRELASELDRVRERGFALIDEELEGGLVAVAAPVFAGGDEAIAAISVSGPAGRLTPRQLPATTTSCVEVARRLSGVLGGQPGTTARP